MIEYVLASLAACANAAASVLQRKANRDEPSGDNLSWRLIADLLHEPVWFAGVLAVIAGFLLQATALGYGQLAAVQPILAAELPVTLILASRMFRSPLGPREWGSAVAMTAGLAGLLYFLSPSAGRVPSSPWLTWTIGIGANVTVVAVLVGVGRRQQGPRRAALLGVATGATFGLTAALMKGMDDAFSHGIGALFTSWKLYAMVAAGALAMFLLQSAMNAGRLLAAQPGITLADPVVAILWGTVAFGERTRPGIWLVLAILAGVVMVAAVLILSRSDVLSDQGTSPTDAAGPGRPDGTSTKAAPAAKDPEGRSRW